MANGKPCSKNAWCPGMQYALDGSNNHGKGLSVFWTISMAKGTTSTDGVLYKRAPRDTGLILNYCPWCKAKINWVPKKPNA